MSKTRNIILERFGKDLYLERVFPALREKKTRQFLTLAMTLFAITFFVLFAVDPTIATIADLRKQLSDNQFADQQLQDKISNLSTLEQKYNNMQNDLPAIFAALPQEPDSNVLLGQLYALAINSHLNVAKIQSGAVQLVPLVSKAQMDQTFDFLISVTGTKDNIMTFLKESTQFERVITIGSLVYSVNSRDTTGNNPLMLDMKGQGHFMLSQ